MNFEEARQQHARRVSEMRAGAAFNLREIGLAEASAHFLFEGAGEVLLGHLAAEAAEGALDESEVTKFFAEFHWVCRAERRARTFSVIMVCNIDIAIRYVKKRAGRQGSRRGWSSLRLRMPRIRTSHVAAGR